MAIANLDQIINDVSVNARVQELRFEKSNPNNYAAQMYCTLWGVGNNPVAGATPTVGMAGAVTCDSTTVGSLVKLTAPTGGRSLYLLSIELWQASAIELLLVDRLAHANISNAQATAAFSPVIDGTARLASGEGAQLILEITSALSGASNTRTFTYTNQAGTAGRTTKPIVTGASYHIWRMPNSEYVFVPLQDGDTGIRTITDTTLSSGAATGAYNVVLVKPIAKMILSTAAGVGGIRNFLIDLPGKIEINSNSCLALYCIKAASSTNPTVVQGKINLIET